MISKARIAAMRRNAIRFVQDRATGTLGEYKYSITGAANLYSSCYALMTLHYVSALPEQTEHIKAWAEYINNWQNPETGEFLGPELLQPLPDGAKHDHEHLVMHLATTVLPALAILGAKPRYKLRFAHRFLSETLLTEWLGRRNWADAWLEGNNLIFVLQLLIHLRDQEREPAAAPRIEQVFAWLASEVDPRTGLWGTNGHCSTFIAMCGGYHQLLAYYHERHMPLYADRLVECTLALQHDDGGFSPHGGGGACEDVDAVDILVNMYKLIDHRQTDIRLALRKCLHSVLDRQMPDGGFVYRLDEQFSHMGMVATLTPANNSNMFATWFRIHTLALIAEVLQHDSLASFDWKFNSVLSMGWHRAWKSSDAPKYCALGEIRSAGFKQWLRSQLSYKMIVGMRAFLVR